MKTTSQVDPELHTLRTVARQVRGREAQELESARFAIYAAFEAREPEKARRWILAMRTGLLTAELRPELRTLALNALKTIEEGAS